MLRDKLTKISLFWPILAKFYEFKLHFENSW
jgi:hypothetical protein